MGSFSLVTGGAGFIGSHLAQALVEAGNKVRILDNFSTGKEENISHLLDDIEVVRGDLRDLETVRKAVKGVEFVFHEGALPSVQKSVGDPLTTNHVNITGTLHVLMAARDEGVRRVIYAASSSAYGDSPTLPKTETMTAKPLSPYAVQKYAGEHYCRVFYDLYGLETVSLRYFNVFGPRQDPTSQYAAVIPRFITALAKGEPPTVYGDGEQTRDFTYIDNVVEANLRAARAGGAAGEVINIASGTQYSLNDVLRLLRGILRTDIEAVYTDPRPGDVRHSLADISKARSLLGYAPKVTFEEGLRRSVDSFLPKKK
jgi:nucleoside-diphosphate-sugar epimerase